MYPCRQCGDMLQPDDIGLYRKLIERDASPTACLCRRCTAQHFRCDVGLMEKKIRQFKAYGCILFAKE